MSAKLTIWTNEVIGAVLRKEREIIGIDREPYGVGEQGMTGGPVLRGPWGSIGGMQSQFAEYEQRCKQFIAAYVHGYLVAKRHVCQSIDECIGWHEGYCQRCGGEASEAMQECTALLRGKASP